MAKSRLVSNSRPSSFCFLSTGMHKRTWINIQVFQERFHVSRKRVGEMGRKIIWMPNGDEDHLQKQEIPRCRLFTEMKNGAEISFWNQKDCMLCSWPISWHGAEAIYSLVFMVKTETKYHKFYLFPWHPPCSRSRRSVSPSAHSGERRVGEEGHWGSIIQASQIALCLVFYITYGERSQICFGGLWGRFSGIVYLLIKVVPLIKNRWQLKIYNKQCSAYKTHYALNPTLLCNAHYLQLAFQAWSCCQWRVKWPKTAVRWCDVNIDTG